MQQHISRRKSGVGHNGLCIARRAVLVAAGCVLTLIQGSAAAQAAELPQVLTGVNARFDGAQLPVVTGNNMVISQFADKATLHWQSFDIGAGNKVEFQQPTASSVALNRIFDAVPSQVNGQLTANGQVFLINQNGIVFGPSAQVNTQSLVASTLDIDDEVYNESGFVNAINQPPDPLGAEGPTPAFESFGQPMGEIRIAAGAELESAAGGRILVFAPTIVNEGTIRTPEGQQVLAAVADKVLIAASDDPSLRGLLVEVSTGGDVTNLGSLIAERGNISLVGLAVNQEGVARATTSVALNGSIRLLARDMNGTLALGKDLVPRTPEPVRGGELRLGAGSVTEVVPDAGLDEDGAEILALDAQSQPKSEIDIQGTRVRLESGSRVTATGGFIDLTAALNPGQPDLAVPGDPDNSAAELVVAAGAVVDASGDDSTVVPVTRNVVEVEARGNELADSPLQRDGPIRNEPLRVDIRRGTDFLNIEGAVAGIGRGAAERQSPGGSIRARSEGRVVIEEGARVDVSGGQVTYTEALVSTSRLQQANGKVVEISSADPDQAYRGVVDDAVTREAGYVEGKDAGSLTLQARGFELAGDLRAGSLPGANQRLRPEELLPTTPVFARPFDQAPRGGAWALQQIGPALQELVIGEAVAGAAGTAPLVLSAEQVRASGAGIFGFGNAGPIRIDGRLELPAWTELTLTGTEASIVGDVRIPGGVVSLRSTNALVGPAAVADEELLTYIDGAVDLSGTWVNDNPLLNRTRATAPLVLDGGRLLLDSGFSVEVSEASRLDVSAGAWRRADGSFSGGRGGSLGFTTGAADDIFAGARLSLAGELRAFGFSGGGTLSLDTERIQVIAEPQPVGDDDLLLDGSRQFGLREVGDEAGNRQYVLEIGAGAFQQGGFSSYSLASSRSDLELAAGASLPLRTASLLLTNGSSALLPTGTAIGSLATPVLAPDFERAPVRLTLTSTEDLANAIGPVADLRIAAGASIVADAGSAISLNSTTSLFVEGTIAAPAGQIDLRLGETGADNAIFQPAQMIWLGAGSLLTASGAALIDTLNPLGLRRGQVLDAGRVSVRANQGSIIGAAGGRIAVDGIAETLDTGFGLPVRTIVAGAAGEIELTAAESLLYQGALSGAAPAGFAVPGGRLTVSIDPSRRGVPSLFGVDGIPRGPHRLVFADFAGELPGAGQPVEPQYYSTGFVPLGALRGGGFSSLDAVVRSSATGTGEIGQPVPDTPDSLPVIEFPADLDLSLARSIRLDAAILETDSAQVALAAPYVSIGYSDARVRLDGAVPDKSSADNPQETTIPIRLTPTAGNGSLRVTGEFIELVGESVTQGFGDAAAEGDGVVLAASGDLRLRGVRKRLQSEYDGLFRTAGDLRIEAQRVYPGTLTSFELAVEGAGGRLTLAGGGAVDAPLAVGGALTLGAEEIIQGGALFAPLGELNLTAASALRFAPGSLTSTSAAGVRAPFFRTEPGGALVLPAPGSSEDQIVFVETVQNAEFERQLPEKRIALAAPVVDLQAGSQFDLRGGGEVAATEFVPGPGGSLDILLADLDTGPAIEANESFAILPGLGGYAPYDPLETPDAERVQGLRIGDTLVLAEGLAELPAGEYAVLPARYALFGGYLVTPEDGFQDLGPGAGLQRLDGAPILAGRFGVAGSDAADGRSRGFALETGEQVRQRAEYLETLLDEFYTEGVVRAPRDAGRLAIAAGDRLELRGELIRDAFASGLGSAVDIATTAALAVVNELTGSNGIELRALDLANLGADSLLLGGTRTALADGLRLEATSSEVTVAAGVELGPPILPTDLPGPKELLLVGDRIVVAATAEAATRLRSGTEPAGTAARILVEDGAAVLALSDRPLSLDRGSGAASGDGSSLVLSENATVEAGGGLVLDATGDVDAAGSLLVRDGTLSLGASRVSLGETDGQGIASGLVLSNADLTALAGGDLRLRSGSSVDIFGAVADTSSGSPLEFGRLTIDAPVIRGLANEDRTAILSAGIIELGSSAGAAGAGPAPAATGSLLRLQAAERIELGNGATAVRGYAGTELGAGAGLLLTGDGELDVDGTLAIAAPLISAAGTTDSTLRASGALVVSGSGTEAVPPADAGLGAALTIGAATIDFGGRVVLPAGTVRLTQVGDPANPPPGASLRIAENAIIDVAGQTLAFGPKSFGTPGGAIELSAQTGALELAAGARLDVSGAPGDDSEAGELRLRAPSGELRVSPQALIRGESAAGGGRFVLDAGSLAGAGSPAGSATSELLALLQAGGFSGGQSLRLRQQDLVIESGSAIAARDIRLVSDSGSLNIAGTLDASGAQAGRIWLAAGDRLEVSGTLSARATADGADGGRIDLYALDADGDDPDGASADVVSLGADAVLDVSPGAGGSGGRVFVHGRRLDSDLDGQTDRVLLGDLSGQVIGAGRAQLVATRVLRDPDAIQAVDPDTGALTTLVSITAGQIESWRLESEAFLAGLPEPVAGPLQVTAGLQIESSGDLVLRDSWDFLQGWYFGEDLSDPLAPRTGLTGVATLRAAGNLELQADLTDAFTQQFVFFGLGAFDGVLGAIPKLDEAGMVVEGPVRQSWGYRLTAGADLASADVMASGERPAELQLGPGVRIRTGTADIDIAASGDVRLGAGAAIYSAGRDRGLSAQLSEAMAPALFGLSAYDYFGIFLNGGQFADDGGDVSITAGGDLVADEVPGSVSDWLTRVGSGVISSVKLYSATEGYGAMPTHWGVAYGGFRNGVGAFGGGDLRVAVGGDVSDALLAVPTTGRALDGVVVDTSLGTLIFQPSQRTTEILGGGALDLRAGGSIDGSQLVIGRGTASVRSGGDTGTVGGAPQLYVGADASVNWVAGGTLQVGELIDPTVVDLSDSQLTLLRDIFGIQSTADFDNRFFTYTEGSRVGLGSLGGDVVFSQQPGFLDFLPPSLTAVAYGGDVIVGAPRLDFFPAANSTLELVARDNVTGNDSGSVGTRLRQSDEDRSLLPSVDRPDIVAGDALPAPVPVHTGDAVPNLIIARDGSIRTRPDAPDFWTLEFAKPTLLQAGTDISNLAVRVQQIAGDALSSFRAGRDIVQGELRDPTGRFAANDRRIYEIAGPGAAEFFAYRDISLGTSAGIESIGNARNPALSGAGAELRLLAGTGGEPAYDRFIEVYLSGEPSAYRDELNAVLAEIDAARAGFPASSEKTDLTIAPGEYAEELAEFLADNGIAVADDDPLGTFRSLDRAVQRAFLGEVVFAELEEWGAAAIPVDELGRSTQDRADRLNYTRGYTALDTLFELGDSLGERAGTFEPGAIQAAVRDFLTITDQQAAVDAQKQLFGALFPQGEPQGDISLLLSQVQTLAGGNLSMLAPGGDINAGAADADIIDKQATDLGIVTATGGDINIAVDNDLLVNSTRVFALQGDLLVWSSHGNIDAGKGAKTVTSVPDPITSIDSEGNLIVQFPPAVAGSGLQGEKVALFAPRGQVDAGDAGIKADFIVVDPVTLANASNISLPGGSAPTVSVPTVPLSAASASSTATRSAEQQTSLSDPDEQGERKILDTEVSFVTVEVLSFGDGECQPGDEDCN